MKLLHTVVAAFVLISPAGCGSPRESAASADGEPRTEKASATRPRIEGPVPRELLERNDVEGVEQAIEDGADVNAFYDEHELNALHIATSYRAGAVVQALLDNGADVDAPSTMGWTPLLNCVTIDSSYVADILLQHGADPNRRDRRGETPLMLAAHMGFHESGFVLINHGADVNAATPAGVTALHKAAARSGTADLVRILIENGAVTDVKNSRGESPLDVAVAKDRADVAALLRGDV